MIDSKKAYSAIQQFLKHFPNKKERTANRNLKFSGWIRKHCRPSAKDHRCQVAGVRLAYFVVEDLDFVFYDYHRKMLQLVEVKTNNGAVNYAQKKTFEMLDRVITFGAPRAGIIYLGLHYLVMSKEDPTESETIAWDGKLITQEKCWRLINMIDAIESEATNETILET